MNKVKEGINQYCGPAVLSILTGKSVDECSLILASFKGQVDVKEITYADLEAVLKKLRYQFTILDTDLSLYLAMMKVSSIPGFYIIGLPKHVAALEVTEDNRVFFCDNHTKEPIQGASSARMMQRVDKLIKVESKPEPVLVRSFVDIDKYNLHNIMSLHINRVNEYADSEDNTKKLIGHLSVKDNEELEMIWIALYKIWEGVYEKVSS